MLNGLKQHTLISCSHDMTALALLQGWSLLWIQACGATHSLGHSLMRARKETTSAFMTIAASAYMLLPLTSSLLKQVTWLSLLTIG